MKLKHSCGCYKLATIDLKQRSLSDSAGKMILMRCDKDTSNRYAYAINPDAIVDGLNGDWARSRRFRGWDEERGRNGGSMRDTIN